MGQDKIGKVIRILVKRVNRVENEVSTIGDDLDRILQDELNTAQEANPPLPASRREPRRRRESSDKTLEALRNQAKAGVTKVSYDPQPDGRTKVTIDGGPGIKLSPVLVKLLQALCLDSGDSNDVFVGFKRPFELARMLGKSSSKEVKQHAVCEAIRRLRNSLLLAGYNPYLVQNDRRRGYRFVVRRRDDDVILATCV